MNSAVETVPELVTPEVLAHEVAAADESRRLTVIERRSGWRALDLRDVWRSRELLYFLIWRDIKIRYKQTVFGAAWAILQPLLTALVFSLFFGRFAGLAQTISVPYPVFVFVGILPWFLFSRGFATASTSVVSSSHVITKIYFPRLIIPIAAVGVSVVDFAVSTAVLLVMMVLYGIAPTPAVLLFPVFVLLTVLAALAVGILLSAMSVAYRDFQHVVPFLAQIWMYLTPVIYPVAIVPEKFRWLLALNPMTGVIDGFRYCLLGQPMNWPALAVGTTITVLTLLGSVLYFRRVETTFADII